MLTTILTAANVEKLVEVVLIVVFYALTNERIKKLWKSIKASFKPHKVIVKMEIQTLKKELEIRLAERFGLSVTVNVWQFENSTYSIAGYGFEYMKLITPQTGVGFHVTSFEKIRVEPFMEFLNRFQLADKYIINTINSSETTDDVKAVFTELGIKMGVEYKFDTKDVYKGFLSVALPEMRTITVEDIQLIREYSILIYKRIKSVN